MSLANEVLELTEVEDKPEYPTAEELVRYIKNDNQLYQSRTVPTIKNLMRKMKSKKYDHELSKKAWMYVIEAGAKKFAPEWAKYNEVSPVPWNKLIPMDIRKAAASIMADEFRDEADLGNYDKMI